MWRTRWAAVGAAVAVVAGAGGIGFAQAAGEQPVSVAVAPCRLFDTRAGADNVGAKNTPLGEGDANAMTVQVTGASGRCNLPLEATSVRLNITVVSPSASSFLTLFPADGARPSASALNWSAGQAPTSNFAETTLSSTGKIKLFNRFGSVQLLADVTGYTTGHAPNQLDNNQIARGRWDQDPQRDLTTAISSVGPPAFDGRALWVTQPGSDPVTFTPTLRLVPVDPSTATVGTALTVSTASLFSESLSATRPVFDGRSIWVGLISKDFSLRVNRFRLAQVDTVARTVTRSLTLPVEPSALTFDGTNIWVGSAASATTTVRVNATTGAILTPNLNLGVAVSDLLFDGSKVWVNGNEASHSPTGLDVCVDPATGTAGTKTYLGTGGRLAFDGNRVWSSHNQTTVQLFTAGTCASSGTVTAGANVNSMVFDGNNVWLRTTAGLTTVSVNTLQTATPVAAPSGNELTFDGTAVWSSSPLRRHRPD
jgi:hypothetical protein